MSSWNDLVNIKHGACPKQDSSRMTSYWEEKAKKPSRKDAEPQRYRRENLCVFLAALRALLFFGS
ncbi:MAG: hypothetical protein ACREOI_11585, partial [bacterium]